MSYSFQRTRTWLIPVLLVGVVGCESEELASTPSDLGEDAVAPMTTAAVDGRATQRPATPGQEGPQDKPNIVLITVDTLRTDRLGVYGYERPTSPWLDELASRGVVIEQAFGGSSWTVPSMASIFTALYPFQHQVDRGLFVEGSITHQPVLGPTHETLAEALKAQGYTTFGIATNRHLSRHQGFSQGFDYFVNEGFVNARFVHHVVTEWLADIQGSEPYFLWLHYFDPHDRYQPRRPWINAFDAAGARALPELANETIEQRNQRILRWGGKLMSAIREDPESSSPVGLATLNALYDAEVRYTDKWMKRTLGSVGLRPDTVVVYTSDHGEEFHDHGDFGHRTTLYNEQLTVPFVISAPGRIPVGKRLTKPVTLIDLKPTVMHLATGTAPQPASSGATSLVPTLTGEQPEQTRPLLMSTRRRGELLVGMVDGHLKVIRNRKTKKTEMYDLAADPREQDDLSEQRPDELKALLTKMKTLRKEMPRFDKVSTSETLSADTLEHLMGLGYVDDAGAH